MREKEEQGQIISGLIGKAKYYCLGGVRFSSAFEQRFNMISSVQNDYFYALHSVCLLGKREMRDEGSVKIFYINPLLSKILIFYRHVGIYF